MYALSGVTAAAMVALLPIVGAANIIPRSSLNVTETLKLSPPAFPSKEKYVVDANYVSYSVEFCYMADYAGNKTNPNLFSRQMIQNLYDVSGAYPIIRVGGSTQNGAIYLANQTEGVILKFSTAGADQPSLTTIGPAWMESFQQLPQGTQYIYGLNFFNRSDPTLAKYWTSGDGLQQTIDEATMAYKAIPKSLYAFEIGNEVDGWSTTTSHRSQPWTVQRYVDEWIEYGTNVSKAIVGKDIAKLFQGCAFEAPRQIGVNATSGLQYWNVENAVDDGMGASGLARTVSDHDYMGANCHYTGVGPTIETSIFDRSVMTSRIYYHDYLGNATAGSGVSYVLGETNSISCQGAFNISDVMAAAVWSVDYVLYISSLKIGRVHFHGGTPYRYSAWQATTLNDTAPHVKPLYYGNLLAATAFAGGNKKVEVLANETSLGAYAVYNVGAGWGAQLESVVAANLQVYNSTFTTKRPYTALKVPAALAGARVLRLTNPGVDIADNITFAGQHVDSNGKIVGQRSVERVGNGEVLVGAGEAVLISRVAH